MKLNFKDGKRQGFWTKAVCATLPLMMAACSSSSGGGGAASGATTKSLTIGGTFASLPILSPLETEFTDSDLNLTQFMGSGIQAQAFAAVYMVRCVTLSGPLHSGEGTVDSGTGVFSLSMTAGLNAPIGCFLLADNAIAAVLSFSQETSMSGGTKNVSSYSPRSDSTSLGLGTITVTGGVAKASAISENGSAAKPTFADMTGTWGVASFVDDAANNYFHPCDMDYDPTEAATKNAACKAEWSTAGAGVYINQIVASNGTLTRNGLGLWSNQASYAACGNREGVGLDTGWTASNGWTTGNFPAFTSLNLSAIDGAMLAKAPFKKSIYNGISNCPRDSMQNDLPGCDTANDCSDFSYGSDTNASGQKVRCILNSLSNGGALGFQYGNDCGARANVSWDTLNGASFDNDGTGCASSTCGGAVDFNPSGASPLNRMFFSELFIDGAVGSASEPKTHNCGGGTVLETISITATQSSATAMTFVVEFSTSFIGTTQQKADCLVAENYLGDFMDKTRRMKMEMVKR